ncbi:MAG: protein kinase domain-containing protein [Polyangiales bacterium]
MPRLCPLCHRELPAGAAFCPADGAPIEAWPGAFAGFEPKQSRYTGALLDGRYEIHGFVDQGATSRVYLAEDHQAEGDERIVAVKMFAPVVSQKEAMRRRFLREGEALRAIDHPNVVRVRAIGQTDGLPFLVMDALRGETLRRRLDRTGPLPVDLALRFVRQIAEGLAAAHKKGVIHRDVKPDNIFLDGEPHEVPRVKVIDFGMAKVDDGGSESGLVLGTVQYMAPEQVVSESVDARSDVYALGVTMFRMITGHLPFDVELGTDLIGHQLFSPAPPPSWLDDDLDPRLERVILSAMRKRRENRYPSMEALLEDLGREDPQGWPMTIEPDVYEPVTDAGRAAASYVSTKFRLPR